MSIEDLGNLGDLIAAIATIVTLAYLALQIRENTKSVLGSTTHSHLNLEAATSTLLAQHSDVYVRGCADVSDLSDAEKVVFEQLVVSEMSVMANAFIQHQRGLIPNVDQILFDWKRYYMKQSGFQSVWAELKHSYPDDFCQRLDEI